MKHKRIPGPWPFTEHASEHDPVPDSDLDAVSILLDKERAENERLRAVLARIANPEDAGRGTLIAIARAALAVKKG